MTGQDGSGGLFVPYVTTAVQHRSSSLSFGGIPTAHDGIDAAWQCGCGACRWEHAHDWYRCAYCASPPRVTPST